MSHSLRTLCARAVLVGVGLGVMSVAGAADKASYEATKKQAAAQYDADKAACKPMKANAQDICMAEAKAKERIAVAEARAAYENNDKARAQGHRGQGRCALQRRQGEVRRHEGQREGRLHEAGEGRSRQGESHRRGAQGSRGREQGSVPRPAVKPITRSRARSATRMSGADKDACIAQAKARFGQ